MLARDYRDVGGGALLAALGSFVVIYTNQHYALGDISRMGPGMFPVAVGYVLLLLGALISLPAFFRTGSPLQVRWRPILGCLCAVLLFAVLIERAGIAPTIFALAITAALADNKLCAKGTLLLGLALAAIGVFIFGYALGINVPWFAWRV